MRASVLAMLLLASSSLCSFAQEQGKAPQTGLPTQSEAAAATDQKPSPPPDQNAGRDQQRTEDREMGRDWKLRRSGESERAGREDREIGRGEMMRRGDGDRMGREKPATSLEALWDRMDRDRDYRGYHDDRPRRRIKVCVEYDNGDEYCRYRN